MIAAELYEKTLRGYLLLPPSSRKSLSKCCKAHKINYRSFLYWMKKNSLSVSSSNQQCCQQEGSFVPISVLPAEPSIKNTSVAPIVVGIVKGVRISLRKGIKITLCEVSVKDMIEIINLINPL